MGHREVSCTANKDKQSLWKVGGGIMFKKEAVNLVNNEL